MTPNEPLAEATENERSELFELLRATSSPEPASARDALAGRRLVGADLRECDLTTADLSGLDLSRADLSGANLMGARLVGTTLFEANLTEAELAGADLSCANLQGAVLERAGLGRTKLVGTSLIGANLSGATLTDSTLERSDLRTANLTGARLREVDLCDVDLSRAILKKADLEDGHVRNACFDGADIREANLARLRGYETASWIGVDIRDIDFTGAYLCRRFIQDQNFLEEFRNTSKFHRAMYSVWRATSDCGRSATRWAAWTVAIIVLFAWLYTFVDVDYGSYPTPISPLYYSVVTMTTLGYGDVLPSSMAAQLVAMVEVVLGYVMLGGLLSIFSNKMASRAN